VIGGDSIGIAEVEETLERDRERKSRESGGIWGASFPPTTNGMEVKYETVSRRGERGAGCLLIYRG